jgi:hypothetical protein
MENTTENKEKFFGLYYNQKAMYSPIDGSICKIDSNNLHRWVHELELHLIDLKNITNQDALQLSKIVYNSSGKHRIKFGKEFLKAILNDCAYIGVYSKTLMAYDYLRSKGYALPYMGLSVEKQIEYGWVKLKQNPS